MTDDVREQLITEHDDLVKRYGETEEAELLDLIAVIEMMLLGTVE